MVFLVRRLDVVKRLAILGALALAFGVTVRVMVAPVAAGSLFPNLRFWTVSATVSDHAVAWEPVWAADAPELADMAMAPDGGSVVWVAGGGVVRRLSGDTARTLWQTPPYSGMNRVRVNQDGMALVFSTGRPGRNAVRLLDADQGAGRSALALVDGTITSAELTQNGDRALIGVSNARVYVLSMQSSRAVLGNPIVLPSEPVAVTSFMDATNAPQALCGTQTGALLTWQLRQEGATPVSLTPPSGQPVARIVSSTDGNLTAVAYAPVGSHPARLELWDHAEKKRLWSVPLAGVPQRLQMSEDARVISVNFTRSEADQTERKVTLYDRSGKQLFAERGGLSFSPDVVAISASGDCLTVRDPAGNLWLLDNGGHTVGRLRAPADTAGRPLHLSRALATPDGRYLLLHYVGALGDGHLMLYRFRQAVP